ncbi:MAG: T9SS type A sorting domain-containing protein [Bacteroidales bacterium]|nr:T9SS type A sorting domain-containing protein [Bacteroidales bacterium]
MKKIQLLLLIGILFIFTIDVLSQTEWTYFSEDPILSMDPTISWDAYGQPTVLKYNDTIRMWYAVAETSVTDPIVRGRIHYAWSLDGFTWTKHPGNPVLDVGGDEQWDGQWLDTPAVLWDGTEYKLYYYADSLYSAGHQDNTAIGLATSPDGINWTRQGKVLEKGGIDDWDGHHIELPALYYDNEIGLYAMLYTGMDRQNYPDAGLIQIGLAVSFDGYDWTKWPTNPVLNVGSYPAFNDIGVAGPAIIETDGIFEMFYTGVQAFDIGISSYDSLKVGYAVSLNGTSWIQFPDNPVLQATPGDSTVFWAIGAIYDDADELYKLYFESHHWQYEEPSQPGVFNTINAIFYATAPRTIINSPACDISISEDVIISNGNNTQLSAQGGDFYQWDPPEGLNATDIANPIASPEVTTTYSVLIVNETCITKEMVTVTVEEPSKITENISDIDLKIFPNPASTSDKISFNKLIIDSELKILDITGKIVFYDNNFSGNKINLKSNLKSGTYIVKLSDKNLDKEIKLIID